MKINEIIKKIPVDPRAIDKLSQNPYTTPAQKIAMAKEFKRKKLRQMQTRDAVASAAQNVSDEELALSSLEQASGERYKIVPDATHNQSSKFVKTL